MFLGKAIYETLGENGDLNSYNMTPVDSSSQLVVDDLGDIDRRAHRSNAVDIGPLRMYAENSGLRFQFITARLGGRAFENNGDRISFNIRHTDVPLEPNRAGYYGILLPSGYSGQAELEIWVGRENQAERAKRVFLSDTQWMVSGLRSSEKSEKRRRDTAHRSI
jgi:hypothetical protein